MFFQKSQLIIVGILAVLAGVAFAHWQANRVSVPVVANATVFKSPRAMPAFELRSHLDQPFTIDQFKGKWSVLFFGFTHCPDVCPTTMSMLARTRESLLEHDEDIQVVMISVDPERDNVGKLAAYVPFFDPSFIGVTGSLDDIAMLTQKMGVAYQRIEQDTGNYTIDHTSALFVINPEGALAAISSAPHQPEVLANDLRAIR